MILDKYFQISVEWEEDAPLVRVQHVPTGRELTQKPKSDESVGQVKAALLTRLKAQFFEPEDFQIQTGRGTYDDGTIGNVHTVIHLPSSKMRRGMERDMGDVRATIEKWMDEIVGELWHEGYIPRPSDTKIP